MKRITCATLAFLFLLSAFSLPSCGKAESLTVLDGAGQTVATLTDAEWREDFSDPKLVSYLELVLEEAILALEDAEDLSEEDAEKKLFRSGYVLHTAFDSAVFDAMVKGFEISEGAKLDFASAATDLKGNLVAAVSFGERNFVSAKTQPYSSFKPLSVYMQALERGLIHWSATYVDQPLKKVKDEVGVERDWPANATNTYTYESVPVCEAVKTSLNTVASALLLDVGVGSSISFLKENFGLVMPSEELRMSLSGAEEIIGNLSMGYLLDGVSPLEMAGFYQCFANGGVYIAPKALQRITLNGEAVFERVIEEKRVMTEENAHIMNRLLQGVVSEGGTGAAARVKGVSVGGKTGTGSGGNWFVGFTPEYSCSVWHGSDGGENRAAKLFSQIFSKISHDPDARFPESDGIKQGIYCKKTGLLYSSGCREADVGYYESGKMPVFCDE